MIDQTPWIERTFNFDFPAGYFPCILERVRGTPARLEEMIATYTPALLTRQVNGAWSIQQHAGHLADLDTLHDGRLDDFLSGKEVLRAADITNRKTENAHHNSRVIADVLRAFREQRMKFVARLEVLDEHQVRLTSLHPRLKQPMRLVDMVFFTAEHDDHHLARISRLAAFDQ